VACRWNDPFHPFRLTQSGVLPRGQLRVLNADFTEHTSARLPPDATCTNPFPPDILIYGVDRWGDRIAIRSLCYIYDRWFVSRHPQVFWTPSGAVRRLIGIALRS
jgi:hypothetical protein